MINVRWTGAAGLEFKFDENTILIDPYYSRIGKMNMFFGKVHPDLELIKKIKKELSDIKAIIVGHTHFDHAVDIPGFVEGSDVKVIGSRSLDTLLSMNNLPGRTIVCEGNEKIELTDKSSVTMIPSEHGRVLFGRAPFPGEISSINAPPIKAGNYRHGKVFAPLINIKGKKFLHLGSAGFIENELKNNLCDVVFLCVPGWKGIEDYPEKVVELIKPDTIVLFHHDDFFSKYENKTKKMKFLDINNLINRIKDFAPGIKIIVPELFETLEF